MTKRALVLGIGGQDGSYLAGILLEKGYEVHGLYRRSSVDNLRRIAHCRSRVTLHQGDMADPISVERALLEAQPDEVYNMADQDHVGFSLATTAYSLDITAGAVGRTLETLRGLRRRTVRYFQPLSATMFGDAPPPQNEQTPFAPASPYACAKVAAYYLCQHYRREYGMHVSTAIFFNHDSPRRGGDYLLQRIAREEKLWGDLDTVVEVGYAREYMEAAHAILQLDRPDDFVIGTGRGFRIRDLVEGEKARWYYHKPSTGLIADASKAYTAFGFDPRHDAFSVLEMIRQNAGRCVQGRPEAGSETGRGPEGRPNSDNP